MLYVCIRCIYYIFYVHLTLERLGCNSAVEHAFTMCKDLGSIFNTKKKEARFRALLFLQSTQVQFLAPMLSGLPLHGTLIPGYLMSPSDFGD